MVDTENNAERGGAAPATDFIGYLSEHKVQLREGVTPEQFSAGAEALAHELAWATVAAKGIFKTPVIVSQFESIVKPASSIADVLDKSRFVRDEMEWLLGLRLLESWGRQAFRSEGEFLTDERQRAVEQESERIRDFLGTHPIEELVRAIAEGARAGQQGAKKYTPDTPERRRATILDETIASRCADVYEEFTSHRANLVSSRSSGKQKQTGRFLAFVTIISDRIWEILDKQGLKLERPHPSARTLRHVISERPR